MQMRSLFVFPFLIILSVEIAAIVDRKACFGGVLGKVNLLKEFTAK